MQGKNSIRETQLQSECVEHLITENKLLKAQLLNFG